MLKFNSIRERSKLNTADALSVVFAAETFNIDWEISVTPQKMVRQLVFYSRSDEQSLKQFPK